jgi:DNA primase
VSTPLRWDEVRPELDPGGLNVRTVPARLAAEDPWRTFWSDLQELPSGRTPRASKRPGPRKRRRAA